MGSDPGLIDHNVEGCVQRVRMTLLDAEDNWGRATSSSTAKHVSPTLSMQ